MHRPSNVPLESWNRTQCAVSSSSGINVARAAEVVWEKLCEGDGNSTLRCPAVAFGMIRGGGNGRRGIGRLLHAKRFEQFLAQDCVPIRSARCFRNDPTGQDMSDVCISERRTETRNRVA